MHKLITAFLITLSLNSAAQSELLSVGLEGGIGSSFLYGNGSRKQFQKNATGYASGLTFQFNFKESFALRTGVCYKMKGAAYDDGYTNPKDNFQYINIPLLLRVNSPGKFKVMINAGPFIGLLLKATRHEDADKYNPERTTNRTYLYKHIDAGVSGGVGLSFHLKNKFIFSVEARDEWGLINIDYDNEDQIKTSAFYFLVGFSYGIGSRKNVEK